MIRFTGTIELPDDPGSSLSAVMRVDGDTLTVAGRTETLGSWSKDAVTIYRLGHGRFELVIGDDRVHFLPDNPAAFAAFPLVQEPPPLTKKERKRLAREEKRRRKMEKAQRRLEAEPTGTATPSDQRAAPPTPAPMLDQPSATSEPLLDQPSPGPLLDQPPAAPAEPAPTRELPQPAPEARPQPSPPIVEQPPAPPAPEEPTELEPPHPPSELPADPWTTTAPEAPQPAPPQPPRFRRRKIVHPEPSAREEAATAEPEPAPEPEPEPTLPHGPSRMAVVRSKLGWQWARLLDGLRQTGIWPLDHLPALNGRYIPPGHQHTWRVVTSGVGIVRRVCDECGLVRLGSGEDEDEANS